MSLTSLRPLTERAPVVPQQGRKPRRRARTYLCLEHLEDRCLLAYRTYSGLWNNLLDPSWGSAGVDLIRKSLVAYADGISMPSAFNDLGARFLSNSLNDQANPPGSNQDISTPQLHHLSDFAYVWGQFLDHDLDLTPANSGEPFNIPPGSLTDPMGTEPFTRSTFDPHTGTSTSNPRQQVNVNSSFEDLSQVYGSSYVVANALRTHSGGLMKTSPGNFLPFNNTSYFTPEEIAALNMANDAHQVPDTSLYAAGDVRANENIELTAMQTLFVRNHNRLAEQLHALNPAWGDEQLYQEARKLNIAESEIITYTAFLPAILGPNSLPAYTGYNDDVNPTIATEFSTVGFRFGHSLLSGTVGRNQNDGTDIPDVNPNGAGVDLAADFFDPNLINPNGVTDPLTNHTSSGIGAILKADADNAANEFDRFLISQIRNELFGIPNAPGTDLAARDIQRARDHGIGSYNDVRAGYGLPRVTSFAQITSDVTVQNLLKAAYGNDVNKVDAFEGILCEDHVPGGDVGVTTKAILVDQFTRLRDGDRFFFLNEAFSLPELALIYQGDTLAKIIENNTSITNLQSDVFFFREEISGVVFQDPDGNGIREIGEPGVQGITVSLKDDKGNVLATTTTDANGEYDFTDITGIPGTGNFTVAVDLTGTGFTQNATEMAHNPGTIHLSRGGLDVMNQSFAVLPASSGGVAALPRDNLFPSQQNLAVEATDPGVGAVTVDPASATAQISETVSGMTPPAQPPGTDQGTVAGQAGSTIDGQALAEVPATDQLFAQL